MARHDRVAPVTSVVFESEDGDTALRVTRFGNAPLADACQSAAAVSADLIYQSAAAGGSCWVRDHRGHRRELPMARWMGGPDSTPQDRLADEHLLRHCSSRPTLHLGCGPGRFNCFPAAAGTARAGRRQFGRRGGTIN